MLICDRVCKTGLICTSNYTHSMNHNLPCEVADTPNFTSLCLFSVVSNLSYSLQAELHVFKVIKLEVQIRPVFADPVTSYLIYIIIH